MKPSPDPSELSMRLSVPIVQPSASRVDGEFATEVICSNEIDPPQHERIRVGRDYQCKLPPIIPPAERRPEEQCIEKSVLLWSPDCKIPDDKLDEYIRFAKDQYGYTCEQALGMLLWHKHDIEKACLDMANFSPHKKDKTETHETNR